MLRLSRRATATRVARSGAAAHSVRSRSVSAFSGQPNHAFWPIAACANRAIGLAVELPPLQVKNTFQPPVVVLPLTTDGSLTAPRVTTPPQSADASTTVISIS